MLGFRGCGRWLRVQGFGFGVSGLGSRVSGCGFRVSGFGFRASGFGFRVSSFGFRVSGFGFRVSGFGLRVSGFGFRVSGLGFRDEGVEFTSPASTAQVVSAKKKSPTISCPTLGEQSWLKKDGRIQRPAPVFVYGFLCMAKQATWLCFARVGGSGVRAQLYPGCCPSDQ